MVGALGYGCARTDLAISRTHAVSTLVVSSNGGGNARANPIILGV